VHDEALPLFYDLVKLIAALRPAANTLDLFSCGVGRRLHLAKTLELNISMAFPCRFAPNPEENGTPKVVTRTRRASWNGQSSAGMNYTLGDPCRPSTRARRKSWSGPAPNQMCFETYLRRLEALLHAFNNGGNLRRLEIFIENTDQSLNSMRMNAILRRMGAKLRVSQDCIVVLHIDSLRISLVNSLQLSRFLKEIKP
jgi:hypothetical protein